MENRGYVDKEKELKRETRFLQNIMATVPHSLVVLDRDLRIKSANRSFCELLQTKPVKITGNMIGEMLPDRDGKLSAKLAGLFGTDDMLEDFELHYQSAKLGERILSITARGVTHAEEEELVVIQDMTKRKRMEEEIKQNQKELETLLDAFLL